MAQITVGGQKVTVGDNFFSLPPDQQDETVDEISRSLQPSSAPSGPVNSTLDVAKGLGSGVVRGAAIYAGQSGDIGDAMLSGIRKYKEAGAPVDEYRAKALEVMPAWLRKYHEGDLGPSPVSSQAIMRKIDETTGIPITGFQPETLPGRVAQTASSFAIPGMLTGQGLVRGALMPGAGAELARTAAEGTSWEMPAAIAGAVIGGAALPRKNFPSAANMKDASSGLYNSPVVKALRVDPTSPADLSNIIIHDAFAAGARPGNAKRAFKAITDELSRPMKESRPASVADLQSAKDVLREVVDKGTEITGKMNKNARVASQAIRDIDTYVENIPAGKVLAGNISEVAPILRDARANWAAAMRTGDVDRLVKMAENRAASTYSGGNVNNATRQNLRRLLDNPKRTAGYTAAERKALERSVLGTKTGNAARYIGNSFGGTGTLGMVGPGGSALGVGGLSLASGQDPQTAATIGILTALGARGLGRSARAVGNASQARQTRLFRELVASRSPLAQDPQALAAIGIKPTTRNLAVIQALVEAQNVQRNP
jgi:hypothetical protein